MPHSRELNNKKRGSSDKHKKGSSRKDSGELKKGGAGAHNWGTCDVSFTTTGVMDRGDPNYDSEQE